MLEPLKEPEIKERLSSLKGWQRSGDAIEKSFEFRDFKEAMGFVNRVGDAAEEMDHHPSIEVNYNKVRLMLSTHSAGGITYKDFSLAKKVDGLVHAH